MTAALALFCQADFGKSKRFSFCTFQSLFFSSRGVAAAAAAANVQRERSESIVKFHDGKKKKLAAGPFFCFPTPLFDIKNSQKPSESAERESAYTIIG
jgi:hypothetical protein